MSKALPIVAEAIKNRKRETDKANHQGFVSWVVDSLEKGAGVAHKWTSQKTKAPPLPHIVQDAEGQTWYTPEGKGEYYKKMWEEHWGRFKHEYAEMINKLKELIHYTKGFCEPLEPIDEAMVMQASKLFKNSTGLGVDLWEPVWMKAMTKEAAFAFAQLLNAIEDKHAWPAHILINIIVLMGRPPPGGVRPIALMPMIY